MSRKTFLTSTTCIKNLSAQRISLPSTMSFDYLRFFDYLHFQYWFLLEFGKTLCFNKLKKTLAANKLLVHFTYWFILENPYMNLNGCTSNCFTKCMIHLNITTQELTTVLAFLYKPVAVTFPKARFEKVWVTV